MLLLGLVWEGLAELPRSPPKPPYIAQAQPIFQHGVGATFLPYSSVPWLRAAHSTRWKSGITSLSAFSLRSSLSSPFLNISVALGTCKGPIPRPEGFRVQPSKTSELLSWHFGAVAAAAHAVMQLAGKPYPPRSFSPLLGRMFLSCCSAHLATLRASWHHQSIPMCRDSPKWGN